MWIFPEKRLCFLANPKTASLATAFTLETLGFKTCGGQHCTPDQAGWGQIDNTWTVFCTVRNHFDVMVSWYFHNIRTPVSECFGLSFEQFLYMWTTNSEWFRNNQMYWERNPWCNRILRYEMLQSDFNELLVSCKLPLIQLQRHNVSKNRKGRDFHGFYTEKSIKFMEDKFGAEMESLNYGY